MLHLEKHVGGYIYAPDVTKDVGDLFQVRRLLKPTKETVGQRDEAQGEHPDQYTERPEEERDDL